MKSLILTLLVLGGVGLGGFYAAPGRLPWVSVSPEEAQVATLRAEFDAVRAQWKQAGRTAALGTDPGSLTDPPLAKLEQLEGALADLTPGLTTTAALNQANRLRAELAAFKANLR
jgi:hypothetical protein